MCSMASKKKIRARPKTEVVYFWLGANSTIDEHTAAAHHTVKLAKEKGGWQQVRVQQGKEPHHLQKIFQNFIIYRFFWGKNDTF